MKKRVGAATERIPTSATFTCRYSDESGEADTWEGVWHILEARWDIIKLEVIARGYRYEVFVGKYINGHYVCIPNWDAGSALATLDDYFWNYGRLTHCMEPVHAVSVLTGLRDFAKTTGWGLS